MSSNENSLITNNIDGNFVMLSQAFGSDNQHEVSGNSRIIPCEGHNEEALFEENNDVSASSCIKQTTTKLNCKWGE